MVRSINNNYMNLGSFKIGKGNRNKLFNDLIKDYEAKEPSSEKLYWLGVAYNDYKKDKEKATNYFILSAMYVNDYDQFHELYYKKNAPAP